MGLSKEEAIELLTEWADVMELDTDGELFPEVVEPIKITSEKKNS